MTCLGINSGKSCASAPAAAAGGWQAAAGGATLTYFVTLGEMSFPDQLTAIKNKDVQG